MSETVFHAELTPKEFKQRIAAAPIAYLPLGTLEWHGEHLPLGADGIQAVGFFEHLAKKVGGIILPMIFLGIDDFTERADGTTLYGMDQCRGMEPHQLYTPQQLPGSAYWVPDDMFCALIEAILKQLKRAGFLIVVGHGHGPSSNLFGDHAAEWFEKFGLKCFNCFDSDDHYRELGIQTDHAATNETSLTMALRPDLVQMDNLSPDPQQWPLAVMGKDPRIHASAELGSQAIKLQGKRMTKILQKALQEVS